ncbi:MAG: hypothetical protein IJC59_05860 [Lachnospiraceae bacterium]|nr:hypothetical protein [Lachnospiraceae bacterium]
MVEFKRCDRRRLFQVGSRFWIKMNTYADCLPVLVDYEWQEGGKRRITHFYGI